MPTITEKAIGTLWITWAQCCMAAEGAAKKGHEELASACYDGAHDAALLAHHIEHRRRWSNALAPYTTRLRKLPRSEVIVAKAAQSIEVRVRRVDEHGRWLDTMGVLVFSDAKLVNVIGGEVASILGVKAGPQ